MSTLTVDEARTMPREKPAEEPPKVKYGAVKLYEDTAYKAAKIAKHDGKTVAEYLHSLIDHAQIEEDFSRVVREMRAREKGGSR